MHAPYFTRCTRENMVGVEIVVIKYEEQRGEGGWGRVGGVLIVLASSGGAVLPFWAKRVRSDAALVLVLQMELTEELERVLKELKQLGVRGLGYKG